MPQSNYALVWPAKGGRITAASGNVQLNFTTGEVTRETGSREKLSNSLLGLGFDEVRSVLVETDQDITVEFDGGFRYDVAAGEIYRIPNVSVRSMTLTTTVSTQLRVWGSTHTDGVPEKYTSALNAGAAVVSLGVGRPFMRLSRLGTVLAGTYYVVGTYTVPTGFRTDLREISFDGDFIGSVDWTAEIGGRQQFRDVPVEVPFSFPYPDNVLQAGTFVSVRARAIGGTHQAWVSITGREF